MKRAIEGGTAAVGVTATYASDGCDRAGRKRDCSHALAIVFGHVQGERGAIEGEAARIVEVCGRADAVIAASSGAARDRVHNERADVDAAHSVIERVGKK